MARTLKEYLQEKGRIPKPCGDHTVMYFAYFNKDKREIGSFEQEIWDVKEFEYRQSDSSGKFVDRIGRRYKFKDRFPYEFSIYEGKDYGEEIGSASGFGDLTVWAYYGFLNSEDMENKYIELTKKYPKVWDEPSKPIIMPVG